MPQHLLHGSSGFTLIIIFCRILLPCACYLYLPQIPSKSIQHSCKVKEMPILVKNIGSQRKLNSFDCT